MKPLDPGLLSVIKEDLIYLTAQWPKGAIADDELRRSSCVLRRLLTYSDLHKVWVSKAGERDFVIPSTAIEILDAARLQEVDFATSSAAESSPGNTLYSAIVYRKIQDGTPPIRISAEKLTPLYKYLFEKTLIVDGISASRNDVVQFVANKLGGAHFDTVSQKPNDKALAALNQFVVMNRPAAMHEMLSYGQQLARSPSTVKLLSLIS